MDKSAYRLLVRIAAILTVAWIGWTLCDSGLVASKPGAHELAAAGKFLEDGEYEQALASFSKAHELDPENIGVLRGKAQTLMRMGIQQSVDARQLDHAGKGIDAATLHRDVRSKLTIGIGFI